VLGFRFAVVDEGARVTELHTSGPIASMVEIGEVIRAVEGVGLAGMERAGMVQALVGTPGEEVSIQVLGRQGLREVVARRVASSDL